MRAVEADSVFFGRSGGGMTLSGGEPLLQGEFAIELLRVAKQRKFDTAIETCGYVDWEVLKRAAEHLNTILFDIKCMDEAKHKEFTGVGNALILSNLQNLRWELPRLAITVRTPLIPGFNDSTEDIARITEWLRQLPDIAYEVLPYHRLGTPKYEYLGRDYPLGDAMLNAETEKMVRELVKQYAGDKSRAATRQNHTS
jgi:pyruvate formate lyase activating enzyme